MCVFVPLFFRKGIPLHKHIISGYLEGMEFGEHDTIIWLDCLPNRPSRFKTKTIIACDCDANTFCHPNHRTFTNRRFRLPQTKYPAATQFKTDPNFTAVWSLEQIQSWLRGREIGAVQATSWWNHPAHNHRTLAQCS